MTTTKTDHRSIVARRRIALESEKEHETRSTRRCTRTRTSTAGRAREQRSAAHLAEHRDDARQAVGPRLVLDEGREP